MVPNRALAAKAIEEFLQALGFDPAKDSLFQGTGERVADAFIDDFCAGYSVDADALIRDNMMVAKTSLVLVRDIAVSTVCPHHLTLASGRATVAFAPAKHLIGIGVVAQVVDAFSRRLALQEEIGENVVQAFYRHLSPHWVACRLVMNHGCVNASGGRHSGRVETDAYRGDADALERMRIEALLRSSP